MGLEPAQLYEALLAGAKTPKKRRNLEQLWNVLQAMEKAGCRDFSIANVGRELGRYPDAIRTQSIRNEQGIDFRRLIQAFSERTRLRETPVAIGEDSIEGAINGISSPVVRSQLREALSKLKKLEQENNDLRSSFKQLRIWNTSGNYGSEKTQVSTSDATPQKLPAELRQALRKGISRDRLTERGLAVQADGSITLKGGTIFPPGFYTAICHILDET